MSGITGLGTTYNLPNYHGELIQLSPTETPLLSAAGGLSGPGGVTDTTVEWSTEDLRDPSASRARLEGADAPTAEERVRAAVTNRVQIFQEQVSTSYTKAAAIGQSPSAVNGMQVVTDEHSHQVALSLTQIARDVNYCFWNSTRVDPSDNTTARQMAGLISVMTSNVLEKKAKLTAISASTDTLTKTHDLVVGDKFVFTDVGASTAVVTGRAYWVTSVSTTVSFKVALTSGGSAITVGTATVAGYPLKQANTVSADNIGELVQSCFDNGGITDQSTGTIFVPSGQRRKLTAAFAAAYGQADPFNGTRNVGGVAMNTIVTDFGVLNIVTDRALPADAVAVLSLEQIQPVFLSIPGKGVLFEEALAKTGASDKTQLYGEIGLKYGNQAAHGIYRGFFA